MGIAVDALGNIIRAGPGGTTGGLHLGAAQAVASGATIAAGQWLFIDTATHTPQIIVSTGASTAPAAGNIYALTVLA
jgi:hypothetical protein